jgi:predicted ABC-type transport system involved in lysophospholipase L1 biosynthesis ATPase subunit
MIDALWDELGFALAIATHDVDVAARAQRVVGLAEGRVTTEETQP